MYVGIYENIFKVDDINLKAGCQSFFLSTLLSFFCYSPLSIYSFYRTIVRPFEAVKVHIVVKLCFLVL